MSDALPVPPLPVSPVVPAPDLSVDLAALAKLVTTPGLTDKRMWVAIANVAAMFLAPKLGVKVDGTTATIDLVTLGAWLLPSFLKAWSLSRTLIRHALGAKDNG